MAKKQRQQSNQLKDSEMNGVNDTPAEGQEDAVETQGAPLEPTPEPTPAPVVEAPVVAAVVVAPVIPTPVVAATKATESSGYVFQNYLNKMKAEGNNTTKNIVVQLEGYMQAMMPGKVTTETEGVRAQQGLWNALRNMIENSGNDFDQAFATVVRMFKEHGGPRQVFHEAYIFRFAEHMTMGKEDITAFQSLINIIKLLAKSNSKADAIRQLDVDRALGSTYSEQGRNRIIAFLHS